MLGDSFCSKCGENLKCNSCGGTGIAGSSSDLLRGKECCGFTRYGAFCPKCGTQLKNNLLGDNRCLSCNGTGRKAHFCLR